MATKKTQSEKQYVIYNSNTDEFVGSSKSYNQLKSFVEEHEILVYTDDVDGFEIYELVKTNMTIESCLKLVD